MALHKLTTEIEKAILFKDFSLGAFLDIEGAFDNTGYEAIMRALTRRNIDEATKNWIRSMLADRIVSSTLGNDKHTISSTRGCPQGGVLSPLLWSLVVDELLVELEREGFVVIGYADDIAVFISGKFEGKVRECMIVAIKLIMNWCRRVGLNANPNRRKLNTEPILVEDQPIQYSSEVKYLGVILDSKLNWGAHIEHITRKATKAIWVCTSYCGRTWGASPELMLSMYQSTVRPIVTYAAWIWWKKADQKTT